MLSQDDHQQIRQIIGRAPSKVEEIIFDTMWSEHCSYKSSKPLLKTLPTKGSEVLLGVGEDAGIIKFTTHEGKTYGIVVSHESHNHPSQILPVEGSATGVGGVVRDVYCMGADVIGCLNSLHFGIDKEGNNPLIDEIADGVVQGVCDYGNPLGVPVLGGETLYHDSYNDNCLVNVAAIGVVDADQIIHSYAPKEAKDTPYDVILFGKSTDATGFGGASFSSATLDKEDEQSNMGAVQVHDPFIKRVLAEAMKVMFTEIAQNKISVGFKDLGAGGISCATSEIAVGGGFGVEVDLDKVNVALQGLPPEVIACSETQERFCIVVPKSFSQRVLAIFNQDFELPKLYPNAGAAIIGQITNETDYVVTHQGEEVCRLPVEAITTEVHADRVAEPRDIPRVAAAAPDCPASQLESTAASLLGQLNNCNKRYVYRFFDQTVQGRTVVYPGEADAVVVNAILGSEAGLAVTMDSNLYGYHDPYVAGAAAVAEGVRNVISVGARPIAVTDCLNYGNPEKPAVFFDFAQGIQGIGDACRALSFIDNESLPIISGNVSLYNESKQGTSIVPSPVICVLGEMQSYKKVLTMGVKNQGLSLILVGNRYPEFGGTQVSALVEGLSQVAPQVRLDEEANANKAVLQLAQAQKLASCHDISEGGLWVSLCEMLLGERALFQVGADIQLPSQFSAVEGLFAENGGYILAVQAEHLNTVTAALADVPHFLLGETTSEPTVSVSYQENKLFSLALQDLAHDWNRKTLTH